MATEVVQVPVPEETPMDIIFDNVLQELEKRGLCGSNNEPPIYIILHNNQPGQDGIRNNYATIYIDCHPHDIGIDLIKQND